MLNGPEQSPPSGNVKKLIVFLHGYGADGHDLIGLSPYFQALLADALCIAPHGPDPTDMGFGRQWFSLRGWQPGDNWPEQAWDEVVARSQQINIFIDAQKDKYGLADSDIALVGFSQGTMMSIQTALRRAAPIAGIVGYSGAVLQPHRLAGDVQSRPPMLLIHGDQDPIVPFAELAAGEKALQQMNVSVRTLVCPGLPHGIDDRGIAAGAQFLLDRLLL